MEKKFTPIIVDYEHDPEILRLLAEATQLDAEDIPIEDPRQQQIIAGLRARTTQLRERARSAQDDARLPE